MSQVLPPAAIADHTGAGCLSRNPVPDGPHAHHHPSHKEHRSMTTIRGGPPLSNTRTSLPQIQSKFDLEPNPFEQSFRDSPAETTHPTHPNTNSPSLDHLLNGSQPRKASSTSPPHFSPENRLSPPAIRHTPGGSAVKVSLPGINSIASPAILLRHTGTSTPKSLSPPGLPSSQAVQSSLPVSMPPSSWSFGGLGDSLRTGPLSPALLDRPAPPPRVDSPGIHTGLTPLLDIANNNGNGTITPGTQALIAILSGSGQDPSDTRNPVGRTSLASAAVVAPNTSTDSGAFNPASRTIDPADPSAGFIQSIDPTPNPSSSSFSNHSQPSTSAIRSPPSPQTHVQNPSSASSRLAPVSVVSVNDSTTPPPSISAHPRRDSSSNSCIQPSMASSLGPSGVPSLHSVSSLGLPQPAISAIRPYSSTTGTSRSPFPQPPMPVSIPAGPPLQSSAEIATPLSPRSTPRNTMHPLPPGSGDRINEHYNTNPLYLLTVAHEASSRMPQLSNHRELHYHDSMDDATATAAAALTGLGSSGGSRYSSPGPPINSHLINNIQNTQSAILKHADGGSSATSPKLSSQRPNAFSDPSSIPAGMMICPDTGVTLLPTQHDAPFANEAVGVHTLNGLLPRASSSASGSTAPMPFPSNYPNHHLVPIVPLSMTDSSPAQQSFSSLGLSASKKKGKKRKENDQAAFEDSQQCNMIEQDGGQAPHMKDDLHSSPSAANSSVLRGASKAPRSGKPVHKAKKLKKSKPDESGDDSDSRDGYWGTEEGRAFMKQQGAEDGDYGDFGGNPQMGPNYDPEHPLPAAPPSVGGKPETEEEKRKNFLERNRQAALKCRQRKKAWLANLQTKVEYLSTENESLQLTINSLREEIDSFRSILVSHKDCPITVGGSRGASTTIGDLVGREPGLVAASAAAILAQQHHHGARAALRHPQAPNSIHGATQVSGTLTSTNGTITQSHHNPHGTVASSYGY